MKNCLVWLIQFYRKHLSLTLFKRRRCTFRDTCSTYALRVAKTQNLTTATRLIYGRWIKKQCSAYALYNIRGYLSWSEGYDHLPKDLNSWVHDMIENKKELPSTIQTILSNYHKILCYRNLLQQAEEVKQILDKLKLSLLHSMWGPILDPFRKSTHTRTCLFSVSLLLATIAFLLKTYILFAFSVIILFWVRKSACHENAFYQRFLNHVAQYNLTQQP